MGLLDRLRPQPAWQHADPTVRLSAIATLSEDQRDVLGTLASSDSDPIVRRAASARLNDPGLLNQLARVDPDELVRETAGARLVDLATSSTDEVLARQAAEAVEEPRALATIARTTVAETVGLAAIARLHDEKLLGGVARRALSPSIRLASLNRVVSEDELATVAIKTDHLDVATAALARMTSLGHLATISARARHKTVARRAGARVRALQPSEPAVPQAPPTDRQRQSDLCARVEALIPLADADGISSEIVRAQSDWAELVPDVDEDLTERFAAACARARDRVTALARERAEHEARLRADTEGRQARLSLQKHLVDFSGDVPSEVARIRQLWHALPPWDSPDASALDAEFEALCAARERQSALASEVRPDFERLCDEAERLAADAAAFSDEPVRERVMTLRREWSALRASTAASPRDLLERFAHADALMLKHEADARDRALQQQRASLEGLERLVRDVEALIAGDNVSLKDLERRQRDVRSALDQMPRLPTRRDHDHLVARLKDLNVRMQPKLLELREIADWERWANAGVQETLCAKAEALDAVTDPADAMRQLRLLEEQWRAVASAPPQKSQVLWRRFSTARDRVRARSERHLAERAREHASNLQQRVALCEEAEALANSVDWLKTAEAIKQLQAQWKTIGPVTRGQEKTVWDRFRRACDTFFTRRHEDLARRKSEWSANLAKKEALCVRAEELASRTDWDAAVAELKRVQADWKAVGPVKRSRSEALWTRFHAATQLFFERYQQRDQIEQASRLAERERLVARLDSLECEGGALPPAPLLETLREVRAAWQKVGALPPATMAEWNARFSSSLMKVVEANRDALANTEFDIDRNQRRMEDLCARVERLVSSQEPARAVSPAAQLATMWREALASNTIGGKVDPEAQFRAAVEDVRDAQAAWRRIGLVPDASRRALTDRFDRACRTFFDRRRAGA